MPYKTPEKKRAQVRQYRLKHLKEVTAKVKAYRQTHPEKARAYKKKWRQANPEKDKAAHKRWAHRHPEFARNKRRVRRAQKWQRTDNPLTHAQWVTIQETQDHRCAYCKKRCKGHLTQDHITPLSQGGLHTLHNVIGACSACNGKKHVGPPLCPVQPLLL